jgi:hypothetical protein
VVGDHHHPRLNRGTRLSLPLKETTHPLSNTSSNSSSSSRMAGVQADTETLTLTHPSSSNTTTPLLLRRSNTSNSSRLTAANALHPSNVLRVGINPLLLRTTQPLLPLRSSAGANRVRAETAETAGAGAAADRNGATTRSRLRARDGTSPSRLRRRSTA